jgi:hypothetical protein
VPEQTTGSGNEEVPELMHRDSDDVDSDDDSDDEEGDYEAAMNWRYGEQTGAYDLHPCKPRDYSHRHTDLEHTAFTQYNVKKGLKIFGEASAKAVVTEMKQLHNRGMIEPKLVNMLTREEKHASLQYLMFLKKKHCGRVKG